MKFYTFIPLALATLALPACVPCIGTTSRFDGAHGQVLDARTHRPLAGALVQIADRPSVAARTDLAGEFALRKRRNVYFFIVLGICGGTIPVGETWSDELKISHPGYRTAETPRHRAENAPEHQVILLRAK
jgi:hypothetical protein